MRNAGVKLFVVAMLIFLVFPGSVYSSHGSHYHSYGDISGCVGGIGLCSDSCFTADTLVTKSSGEKIPIFDIQVGDVVLSEDMSGTKIDSVVNKLHKVESANLCKIVFGNGDNLTLTENHPMFTTEGWKAIDPESGNNAHIGIGITRLEVGDVVVGERKNQNVTNISCVSSRNTVYNLSLHGTVNTYFAGGYLAHNKTTTTCMGNGSCFDTHIWTCFAKGTQVNMASGEKLKIEDVKVGDKVISESEVGERSVSTVTALDQPVRNHMCRLNFADGNVVNLTDEHPLMTKSGWKALVPEHTLNVNPKLFVEKMILGDYVKREDGTWSLLTNIACRSGEFPAYNLILDKGAHTYFADGFLAHNRGEDTCSPSCPAAYCGGDGCGGTCSNSSDPARPVPISPTEGEVFVGVPDVDTSINFSWNAVTDWGVECSGSNRKYAVCVGTDSSPCNDNVTYTSEDPDSPPTTKTVGVTGRGNKTYRIRAHNRANQSIVSTPYVNICIEKYTVPTPVGASNTYFSTWSACNSTTHKRTRTCNEDCGTDNCTAAAAAGLLEEECYGEIRGTIFDASELDACPSFDPTTGYITTLDPTLLLNTRTFSMSDGIAGGTHPWSILTNPITTNSGGNYSVSVYAPSTYTYDFSALRDIYVVSDGPKLTCQSAAAVVPSNDVSCATQPCTTVKNMSFGFLRYVGGWWQTQGAGVHGESGVKSNIPDTLPTEQSLILKDANNRAGVLSYGQDLSQRFGLNNEATVSATGLEVESTYQGLAYDFAYYKQQFKKYSVTDYDPQTILTYDDLGKGYQIFRVTGNIDNFDISPSGTNKMIFLVDGDVTISSNIVVPTGAFLSVIAKGNLTVNTDVTRVDGWYVAKNISVPCIDLDNDDYCDKTDSQFVGNGSFVAWEQVILSRDQGAALNEIQPSEKFVYRIDLYDNAPDPMKVMTRLYKPFIP